MKKDSNNHKNSDKKSENFDPSKFKTETTLTNKAIEAFLHKQLNEKVDKKRDVVCCACSTGCCWFWLGSDPTISLILRVLPLRVFVLPII